MARRLLIALGGNAIKQSHELGTTEEQFRNVQNTVKQISEVIKRGSKEDRLAITHGNGPQVGNLLLQQEVSSHLLPPQSLDVISAMTQGQIGYMIQQSLTNMLKKIGGFASKIPVISIVNQVLVRKDDPDFRDPSKPIGNFLSKKEVEVLVKEKGFILNPPPGDAFLDKKLKGLVIKQVKPATYEKPYRRVVPSPDPIQNIEGEFIRMSIDSGAIVICSGGGGIPVILNEKGEYEGVFAVIDKDLAGERVAEAIGANEFIILTDVEYVKLNYGKSNEENVKSMSVNDAKKYLLEGHFLQGSMEPKIKACIRFLEWGGERAAIGHLNKTLEVVEGRNGTQIYR